MDLIELNEDTASYIATQVQNSLQRHGFDYDYLRQNLCHGFDYDHLRQNLVGICSDGASTVVGKSSGVLTKFKQIYAKLVLWHCMCHRLSGVAKNGDTGVEFRGVTPQNV